MLPPPTPSLEVRAGGLMSLNSVVASMCAAAASMSSSLSTSAALHTLIGAPGQRCCTILIVPNDGMLDCSWRPRVAARRPRGRSATGGWYGW